MAIIRLRAGQACQRCGASLGLPHRSERDCLIAINAEVDQVLQQTHAVNQPRVQRIRQKAVHLKHRLAALSARVARMTAKDLAAHPKRRRSKSA